MLSRYRNLFAAVAALALLFTVSAGCKQIAESLKKKDDSAVDTTETGSDEPTIFGKSKGSDADASLTKKTNLYISKCINQYSTSITNSHRYYLAWVKDPKTGPTGSERIVYGLFDVRGDGQDCADAVAEAAEMDPDLPEVQQAAERYAEAVKEAAKQIREIYPYYDKKDYKDDNFAKGKAAHPALMAAFEKFETADREFTLEVDKLEDEVAQKRLDEVKGNESKKLETAVLDFDIKAKKAMIYASRTEYSQLSADNLQQLADELDTAAGVMRSEGEKQPAASFHLSSADNFVKAYKDLMRRVRDKKPFNSFEQRQLGGAGGWMVEGSPDKVIHEYNSMVRSRSFLRL
jgi:hypothetical protein